MTGDLDRFCVGILANAMEHAEASKIAISTIADYLWDPPGTTRRRVGGRPSSGWAVPATHRLWLCSPTPFRASCLSDPESRALTEALNRFAFESEYGDRVAARRALGRLRR